MMMPGMGGPRMRMDRMKHMKKMHKHMQDMPWYVAEEGDDCSTVPAEEEIMKGDPMRDACAMAGVCIQVAI